LTQSLSNDLAVGALNVERAIAKHRAFRAKEDALTAKIQAAGELETLIEEQMPDVETHGRKLILLPESRVKAGGKDGQRKGRVSGKSRTRYKERSS
jgi:hypothetical protein